MTEQTLAGKVAIISGSSSGIGAAIVRELSSRGANTVVNYPFPNLQAEAENVISSLPSPSSAIAVEADMSQIESAQKLIDAAISKWGRLDILINSVALAVNKPLEEQTLDDWDRLVNINGRGTFLLTKAALPHLKVLRSKEKSRDMNEGRFQKHQRLHPSIQSHLSKCDIHSADCQV